MMNITKVVMSGRCPECHERAEVAYNVRPNPDWPLVYNWTLIGKYPVHEVCGLILSQRRRAVEVEKLEKKEAS